MGSAAMPALDTPSGPALSTGLIVVAGFALVGVLWILADNGDHEYLVEWLVETLSAEDITNEQRS
jgi:hypothetical protein